MQIRVAIIRSSFRVTKCGMEWALGLRKILCKSPGPALELLLFSLKSLALNPIFVLPKTGLYGGFNGTNWDGMVGLIHRNEADISIPVLTETLSRKQAIDFSYTTMLFVRMMFLVNAPQFLPIQGMWKPFDKEVWIALFAAFLFTVLTCVAVAKQFLPKESRLQQLVKYSYGILLDKKSKGLWRHDCLKILLFLWSFSGRIVMIHFAVMFVLNCMPRMTKYIHFTNLGDLAHAISIHGYQYVSPSLSYSFIEQIMQKLENEDENHRKLREALEKHPIKVIPDEAQRVKYISGRPKAFYYGSEYFIRGMMRQKSYSKLMGIAEKPERIMLETFGFHKNFSLESNFSRQILYLREAGIVDQVLQKYGIPVPKKTERDYWMPLPLLTLTTHFSFLCAALLICAVSCMCEIIFTKYYYHSVSQRESELAMLY